MRRLLLLIILMLPMRASAQLSEDQQALLNDVLTVYENQAGWASYSSFTQSNISRAITLTGTDTLIWHTENILQETAVDRDSANRAAQGTLQWQSDALSSEDTTPASDTLNLNFIALDDQVFLQTDGDFAEANDEEILSYLITGLPDLVNFEKQPDMIAWLASATDVFDLGVEETDDEAVQIQTILLEFEVISSLPFINFDLDAFTRQYNGIVELGALSDALVNNSSYSLLVSYELESKKLWRVSSSLEITLTIEGEDVVRVAEGDGVFQLEYARQMDTVYENVGDEFDIEAPELRSAIFNTILPAF